jgi:hypothetical protein
LVGPPQEESRREAALEVETQIFSLLLMSVAVEDATVDGLGVGIRLQEFVATWLGADISLQSIGEVVV